MGDPASAPKSGEEEDDTAGVGTEKSALNYLLLTGSCGWALRHTETSVVYAFSAFVISITHGVVGTWVSAHANGFDALDYYDYSLTIAEVAVLPLINTDLYLKAEYAPYIGYLHLATAVIPIVAKFTLEEEQFRSIWTVCTIFNLGSLIYFAVAEGKGNWVAGMALIACLGAGVSQLPESIEFDRSQALLLFLSMFNIATVYGLAEQ